MKIDPKNPMGETASVASPARAGDGAKVEGLEGSRPRPSSLPPSDQVLLTPRAEEVRRLRLRLDGLPETEHERVAQLRSLIERGAYAVEGERIADAMLRDPATAHLLGLGPAR